MSNADDPRTRFSRPLERPSLSLPPRPGRAADAPPSAPAEPQPPSPFAPQPPVPVSNGSENGGLGRLLGAIAKMLQPKQAAPQPQQPTGPVTATIAEPVIYTIAVAAMNGDMDGLASQALFKTLEGKAALTVKPLPRPFLLESPPDAAKTNAMMINLRHAAAEAGVDMIVWGDVSKEGYRLRFTSANPTDEERVASFGPATRLDFPLKIDDTLATMIYAAVLSAPDGPTPVQRAGVRRLLPPLLPVLDPLAAKPPVAWSMAQQRTVQLLHGHVCAMVASLVAPSQAADWYDKSAVSYRAAEKRLNPRQDPGWENGLMHKHLAGILMARAERLKDKSQQYLEEAIRSWRSAAESLPRTMFPQEWAAIHSRLGAALYRLDLITGDSDLLREALAVLQSAQQVHTRSEAPAKWADIMLLIAQILEVYGDQARNPDVLKRSIDACRLVLEIRDRDRTPQAWAKSMNTLGSTMFLLDRHTGGASNLPEAIRVLEEAHAVFVAHNATGPAQVAARNLAHARKLSEERRSRHVVDPDWAGR